jgi:hypothetical protein
MELKKKKKKASQVIVMESDTKNTPLDDWVS